MAENVQVPGVALHTSQLPAHAVLQQTPSAQKPDWQPFPEPHAAPFAPLALHVPASHQLPVAHCVSPLQGFVHAVPWHKNGAQSLPVASIVQRPNPSHTCPFTTLPTQVVPPHAVPFA
jgi:hypothetical protein